MKIYKIKAFTILEVTITMLIAAILIGITYTSYTIISKSYLSFNTKNKNLLELERFDEWMQKDIDRSEIVRKDTSGIVMQKSDSSLVTYQFNPNYIVRIFIRSDTLNIRDGEFATSFEGQVINQLSPIKEQNILDELNVAFSYKDGNFSYHYIKRYSSANLLNRRPDAIH